MPAYRSTTGDDVPRTDAPDTTGGCRIGLPTTFDAAGAALLEQHRAELSSGAATGPRLAAFAGDDALAWVGLRPFEPGEILGAVLEVLALLLPLRADRIALSLPGRAWPHPAESAAAADPRRGVAAAAAHGDDLVGPGQRVIGLVVADAHGRPCETRTWLHPVLATEGGLAYAPPLRSVDVDAATIAALELLLERRHELTPTLEQAPFELAAQFARLLLLGHELVLAPDAAETLLAASTGRPPAGVP
jgi:hypothetical protein